MYGWVEIYAKRLVVFVKNILFVFIVGKQHGLKTPMKEFLAPSDDDYFPVSVEVISELLYFQVVVIYIIFINVFFLFIIFYYYYLYYYFICGIITTFLFQIY
jgi:hypothetical protein